MAKVIILGGCGAVGSVVVRTLVHASEFSELVIGDFNIERADQMAAELGPKVSAKQFNALEKESCKAAIAGCDLIVNCVGPFYSTVKPILTAAIESRINYVDICDDPDIFLELLEMDEAAKSAGIIAILGMGGSPGATNLVAKLISDELLDQTDSIDIFHTHGGEPFEGEGVIGHRFHCMSIPIPMFLDGELKYVKYFEEDGIALRQTFDFPVVGEVELFPYPHPEQLTLPKYIDVKNVTNKGSVLPIEYYYLTGDVCKAGLASKEPVNVKGNEVVPYDFAMAYLIKERERILKETNFGHQHGAMTVRVKGQKEGKSLEYRLQAASTSQALGEGTGLPASSVAIMVQQGKFSGLGVVPPEGCLQPREFLPIYQGLIKDSDSRMGKEGSSNLYLEQIDADGNVKVVEI